MLDELEKLFDRVMPLIDQLNFSQADPRQTTLVAMYATILEYTDSAITLLKANKDAGVGLILRAVLEGFVDVINLTEDAAYIDYLRQAFLKERIQLAKRGLAGDNPYLASLKGPEVEAKLKEHETDLASIAVPNLNISGRFTKAGMQHTYQSVYLSLSSETHNNVGALSSRHLRTVDGVTRLIIFADVEGYHLDTLVDGFLSLVSAITVRMHEFFASAAVDEVRALLVETNRLRAERGS